MQKLSIICVILFAITGCVQSTRTRVGVLTLDVSGIGPIKSVGVRGEGNPLSWDKDYPMTVLVRDSLYTVTVTGQTPYDFTEVKFTVNGEFELEGKENRRLVFTGDTTYYRAKFNVDQSVQKASLR
jgi:putative oxidoreductase